MSNSDMMEKLMDIMRSLQLPGKLIFAKVAGSHSHNTNIPSSDLDALGVYIVETDAVLGLDVVKETIDNSTNDFCAHEVGKFCRLLLKGNPSIIEMLYTERMVYSTGPWEELKSECGRFLSCKVLKSYLGYMESQMIRLEKNQRLHTSGGRINEKWSYHFLRLGGEAVKIAQGKEPTVWLEGPERDFLMDVRAGKYSEAQVLDMAKKMIADIESRKPWPLPEEGDGEWLNGWLLRLRKGE